MFFIASSAPNGKYGLWEITFTTSQSRMRNIERKVFSICLSTEIEIEVKYHAFQSMAIKVAVRGT